MRPCFAFTAKTATQPAVLAIDDEIGFWGLQAKQFREMLDAVQGDDLRVEINSPGGDVMAGVAIYNMLRSAAAAGKNITTRTTGVAASIASVIMLAGDTREMPSNSFAMIHGVSSGMWGTVAEMAEHAETMKKIQGSVRNIYMDRMGVDEATADGYMAKDNWLTAQECLDAGFATALLEDMQVTAKFNVDRADMPAHVTALFKAQVEDPTPPAVEDPQPEPEPEAPDTPQAEAIVARATALGLEAHGAFFAVTFGTLAEAQARMAEAREITALCKIANLEASATAHIRSGKKPAEVRAALVEAMAATDVDTESAPANKSNPTNGDPAKPAVVNTGDLWASHNAHHPQMKKGR